MGAVVGGCGGDFEFDLAAEGEFDGVAEEVDEDLAEAEGVSDDGGWDIGADAGGEVEVFFSGGGGDGFDGVFDAGDEAEGSGFEVHATGLDFGEVEDVIDDDEEGFCAAADGGDEVALLGGEIGLLEELGKAEDPVHGGTDFVGHGGEEFAFGAVGEFCGFFGADEFCFGAFTDDELSDLVAESVEGLEEDLVDFFGVGAVEFDDALDFGAVDEGEDESGFEA